MQMLAIIMVHTENSSLVMSSLVSRLDRGDHHPDGTDKNNNTIIKSKTQNQLFIILNFVLRCAVRRSSPSKVLVCIVAVSLVLTRRSYLLLSDLSLSNPTHYSSQTQTNKQTIQKSC
mmetsp:Transcript_29066/g.70116  ORF Transcript_29066/g.70116 Transcript_29066/m.70116 type:complete len:117 (+) Transcript_29066:66-416(+)